MVATVVSGYLPLNNRRGCLYLCGYDDSDRDACRVSIWTEQLAQRDTVHCPARDLLLGHSMPGMLYRSAVYDTRARREVIEQMGCYHPVSNQAMGEVLP